MACVWVTCRLEVSEEQLIDGVVLLDGRDVRASAQQVAREIAGAWPDLEDRLAGHDARSIHDRVQNLFAHEEVLPQAALGFDAPGDGSLG